MTNDEANRAAGEPGFQYVVKDGEDLASIAARYRFGHWRKIYDHAQNGTLRSTRLNPDVLFPGDVLFIPAPEEKEELGSTGRRIRFVLRSMRRVLRITVEEPGGERIRNAPYDLVLRPPQGGTTHKGV